jgi:sensor histidine kinase YesM
MILNVKEVVKSLSIGIVIFLIIIVINFMYGSKIAFNQQLGIMFLYTMLYSIVLGYANRFVFVYLDKKYSRDRFSTKRMITGFITSFLVTIFIIFLLQIFINVVIEGETLKEYWANEKLSNYVFSTAMSFIILLCFYVFYIYKEYNESKVKEQKIIAGTANAKFESLKNQIDPHFLFNSLNVLSSLIEENPDSAQKFTTSLSKIYRYVLEQKDKDLVTLQEELAFAKTYMNLLKMRFENSISFELPETFYNQEAKVVPLSLQLLLENCIKHNIVSEQKPLNISITVADNYLIIQNDLQKKDLMYDRRGVGLQNIISRYSILTQKKVLINESNGVFAVHLPILTKQITVSETSTNFNENSAYYRAKKRVEELKGFYGNLIAYCCIIPILIVINLYYSPQFQWFWFSAAGWGFGVIMHAFKVFGYSSNWEERKINEILDKQNNITKTWN